MVACRTEPVELGFSWDRAQDTQVETETAAKHKLKAFTVKPSALCPKPDTRKPTSQVLVTEPRDSRSDLMTWI